MTTFGNRFRNCSALTFLPGVIWKSERRQSEHGLNLGENRCDVLQPVSPGNASLEMNSSLLLSQTCSKEEGSCRIACLLHSFLHYVNKPQKGCRQGICFEVRMEKNHPSGLVWTAANENEGVKQRWGAAAAWSCPAAPPPVCCVPCKIGKGHRTRRSHPCRGSAGQTPWWPTGPL